MILGRIWDERRRYPIGTREWLRAWAKRVSTMPALLRHVALHRKLRRGGARVHETAVFGPVRLQGRAALLSVGPCSFLGDIEIALHAPVAIGASVVINDGAKLFTASHSTTAGDWATLAKPVDIGDFAWIAERALVLPGVRIGRGAVIGAGAVVSRDVPEFAIVVGNPAKASARKRTESLGYDPTRSVAFVEAWLGPPEAADR